MKRKNIIIAAVAIVLATVGIKGISYAILSETEKIERITQKMAYHLDLTNEQKSKVFEINMARSQGFKAACEAGRDKALLDKAISDWKNGLAEVLTKEQQGILDL